MQQAGRVAVFALRGLVAAGRAGDAAPWTGQECAQGLRSLMSKTQQEVHQLKKATLGSSSASIGWGKVASMGLAAGAACLSITAYVAAPAFAASAVAAPPEVEEEGGMLPAGPALIVTAARARHIGPKEWGLSMVVADGVKITSSGGVKVKHQVVFVLGGPGSGKGTQCEKLTSEFSDIAHFSAGDLLREHVKSGTPDGNMVADMIKNGQIVPAEVTVGLLQDAMQRSGKPKILIDGFPRNDSNREVFKKVIGYDCQLVLYFDCPEDILEKRLLSRNQGRVDDNIETIKKRFKVFLDHSLPVIAHYTEQGKARKIDTDRPVEVIYTEVRSYIMQLGH